MRIRKGDYNNYKYFWGNGGFTGEHDFEDVSINV